MTIDLSTVGQTFGPISHNYGWRDVALYALGLSAGTQDLKYLLDDPPAAVLPTYGVIPAFGPVFSALAKTGGNLLTLLHTAQRTEQIRPMPPEGEAETTATIAGIWDMKIGALVQIDTDTSVNNDPCAKTSWSLLLRGEGGFGGPRPPKLLRASPPAGAAPLFSARVATTENQALLYRLSGDTNPIHSHPEVAIKAGFEKPILHGLCFYGIAARIALKELAGDDTARFRAFDARFAKPVYPGQTLLVEGWPLEPGRAALTVTVAETGEKAIANAVFEHA